MGYRRLRIDRMPIKLQSWKLNLGEVYCHQTNLHSQLGVNRCDSGRVGVTCIFNSRTSGCLFNLKYSLGQDRQRVLAHNAPWTKYRSSSPAPLLICRFDTRKNGHRYFRGSLVDEEYSAIQGAATRFTWKTLALAEIAGAKWKEGAFYCRN